MHCGVMLIPAMLPMFPDDAHLTLVYGGEDQTAEKILRMQDMMRRVAPMAEPFAARTMGINNTFGDNNDEPVLLVGLCPELIVLRSRLLHFNESKYPEFRPHIAVPDWKMWKANRMRIPRDVYFTQIAFWLGDDKVTVWLGTGDEVR